MINSLAAMAIASLAMPAMTSAAVDRDIVREHRVGPARKNREQLLAFAPSKKIRSRWKAARRKPHRNLRHVSRRVRRKHRRAA